MFQPEISEIFKSPVDGRFSEMETMDILNYDSNEFMSSEFFDTIRSVNLEEEDLFKSNLDDFNALSDASSHIEGSISPPRNEVSESERSSTDYTDESVSPGRVVDIIDDSLFELIAPNNFEIQATPVIINQPKPSKIIIQNPNNPKKAVHKQIINQPQIKKFGKNKILKVQSFTANGKSVLVPYGVQTIKVINTGDLKGERIHVTLPNTACRRKVEPMRHKDESHMSVGELTEVKLTSEEKRLLDKEGIQLPAYHPLTKLEDRELKRIRRKIRNKISAQDSRKRKKEYVDNLEDKVRQGSEDNKNLVQRIKELQRKNKTLVAHINKLQSLLFNSSSSKATPSTCLMIVMLSVLLVSLPNINLTKNTTEMSTEQEQVPTSRSLLSTVSKEEDAPNMMDEFFVFNKEDKFDENDADNENSTENDFFKNVEDIEKKYDSLHFESASDDNYFNSLAKNVQNLFNNKNEFSGYISNDYGGFHNKRGFIEPDIDDYEPSNSEPPAKKMKLIDDYYRQNDENFVPFAEKVLSATVQTTNTLGESKDK